MNLIFSQGLGVHWARPHTRRNISLRHWHFLLCYIVLYLQEDKWTTEDSGEYTCVVFVALICDEADFESSITSAFMLINLLFFRKVKHSCT